MIVSILIKVFMIFTISEKQRKFLPKFNFHKKAINCLGHDNIGSKLVPSVTSTLFNQSAAGAGDLGIIRGNKVGEAE